MQLNDKCRRIFTDICQQKRLPCEMKFLIASSLLTVAKSNDNFPSSVIKASVLMKKWIWLNASVDGYRYRNIEQKIEQENAI